MATMVVEIDMTLVVAAEWAATGANAHEIHQALHVYIMAAYLGRNVEMHEANLRHLLMSVSGARFCLGPKRNAGKNTNFAMDDVEDE